MNRSTVPAGKRLRGGFASRDKMGERTISDQATGMGVEKVLALLDSAKELFLLLSPQGDIQFASAGFTRLLGYPTEDLISRPVLSLVHPQDVSVVAAALAELSRQEQGLCQKRCRLRSKGGSWCWFDASGRDCSHVRGVQAMLVNFQDATALQRMEAERQVISEVVHALNQTANLDELLGGIHQALKKVMSAENCFVALHDPVADTFSFPFFADQVDVAPAPQRVGHSCTAYVFRTGTPMLIPQSEFDRLAAAGEVELVGAPAPAWLGVPLMTPSATIGVLAVQHYENEHAYDQRDLEFLSSVGGHIALAIERRRSDEALRKNEEMFRLLFTHNPLPTWVIDRETLRFLQVNEAAVRVYEKSFK